MASEHIEPTNNIEEYRKKRRRKRRARRLVGIAVLLAVVGLIAFFALNYDLNDVSDLFGQGTTQGTGNTGYPKKLFGDRPAQFETSGSLLAMVTDSKLYLYNTGGGMVLNAQHSYSRPAMACSGKQVLLYDRGGNYFRTVNSSGTIYERDMSNEIITGAISGNGTVAIAAHEERYAGSVSVFNLQNQQTFKWYLSDNQITGMAFQGSGSRLAVSCIGARDGAILSSVNIMDTAAGSGQQVVTVEFPDMMILSVRFTADGSITVVGDTKTVRLSAAGELQAEYAYGKGINNFCVNSSDVTVLSLASSSNAAEQEIVVLDQSAKKIGSVVIKDQVKWMTVGGGSVFLLSGNEILQYDYHMNLLKSIEVRGDAKEMCVIGSDLYVLGLGEISKFAF